MATASLQPIGAWVGASFGRLKNRWLTVSTVMLIGFLATALGVALVYTFALGFIGFLRGWDNLGRTISDPRKLGIFLEQSQGAFAMFNLLAAFVGLRLYCWMFHAAIHASAEDGLGVRGAFAKAKPRGYAFLALFVVQQILLQVGMLLFVLPGIVMAVLFGFALWAFARDDAGVFEALGDSARMVKGNFLGVLGRMLLVGLIALPMMIVPVVGWFVGAAFAMVAWSELFSDVRRTAPVRADLATTTPLRPKRATV